MQEIDRTRRVGELIKRELAWLVARELNDDRINSVTITAVTVSRDLKQSTVYFSHVDPELDSASLEGLLNQASKYLRRLLAQRVKMRSTPAMTFKYDQSIDRGAAMSQLIEKLNQGRGQE